MNPAPKTIERCKKMLAIRTFCLVLNAVFLVRILKDDIVSILDTDAVKMERWDPTEIIAEPFPIETLRIVILKSCRSVMTPNEYILTSILGLSRFGNRKYANNAFIQMRPQRKMVTETIDRMMKYTIGYMVMMATLNLVVLFIAILCGASPFQNLHHTTLATVYFTTLAFGYIQPGIDDGNGTSTSLIHGRFQSIKTTIEKVLFAPDYDYYSSVNNTNIISNSSDVNVSAEFSSPQLNNLKENLVNELNCYILYGTILTTIPFMVLNILDHGDQNQRWPMPILLGALCGHIVGIVLGTLVGLYRLTRLRFGKITSMPMPMGIGLGMGNHLGKSPSRSPIRYRNLLLSKDED